MLEYPVQLETERLLLRKPKLEDASEVFRQYAADSNATQFMSWPRHLSIETTKSVMQAWLEEWEKAGVGAFVICDKETKLVIGATGLHLQRKWVASTGYILTPSKWSNGFATEALAAVVDLAHQTGIKRLYATCHFSHHASAHVLLKNGFVEEGRLRNFLEFPNFQPGELIDALMFAWTPEKSVDQPI